MKPYIPYASNDLNAKKAIVTLVWLHGKLRGKEIRRIVDKVLGAIDLHDLVTIGVDLALTGSLAEPVRRVRKVER